MYAYVYTYVWYCMIMYAYRCTDTTAIENEASNVRLCCKWMDKEPQQPQERNKPYKGCKLTPEVTPDGVL